MSVETIDWTSFWDLASPAEAADLLREFYGPAAADAATHCAAAARNDDRASDHQFWLAVAAQLAESPALGSGMKCTPH